MASSDDFCLKWNDHHDIFFRSAERLCETDLLTDVTLSCGSREFAAHKLVLSVCSQYFAQLFAKAGKRPDPRQAIVYLKDVDPRHMELLLSYMYRGEINVQEQELMELLATAKSLQIKGLADSSDSEDANAKSNNSSSSSNNHASSAKKTHHHAPSSSSGPSSSSKATKPPILAPKPALKRAQQQESGEVVPDVKRIKEEAYHQEGVASTSKGVSSGAGPSGSQQSAAVNQEEEEDYEALEGEEAYDEDEYGIDESGAGGAVPEGGGP